jgi:hypothetical protein
MGVNFKPFSYSNSKSTSNLGLKSSMNPKYDYSEKKEFEFSKSYYKGTNNEVPRK